MPDTETQEQARARARAQEQQADEKLAQRTTLLRPPEKDPSRAPIEDTVDVSELSVLGPDIFTNTHRAWVPLGARGIYGGTVIAQSLAAAQRTVPDDFLAHSCHCYFLLAGSGTVPILYHVERVRDGRTYVTRTVQARQRGRCIFTVTISFARHEEEESEGGDGSKTKKKEKLEVRHAAPLPEGLEMPQASWDEDDGDIQRSDNGSPEDDNDSGNSSSGSSSSSENSSRAGMGVMASGPLLTRHVANAGMHGPADTRRCRRWIRCRGRISAGGGHRAHLSGLAYLSDSNLINTVARIHRLWRHPVAASRVASVLTAREQESVRARWALETGDTVEAHAGRPRATMIVSLDHSIYFHEPARVRADEWMFTEMESPWSGDGRGVVMMRVFARDGTLLASCVQEGVVRLQRDDGDGGDAVAAAKL